MGDLLTPAPQWPRPELRPLLFTLLFNSLIALFLYLLGVEKSFTELLVISHGIGISIHLYSYLFGCTLKRISPLMVLILSISCGLLQGALIAWAYNGFTLESWNHLQQLLLLGLLFGVVISYFFYSREQTNQMQSALVAAKLEQLESQRHLAEMRLSVLQAQMEPHFLFNTLSNIRSLIDVDSAKAGEMVDHLSEFLRISLDQTRDTRTTLAQELATVESYLGIQKIRMGTRLQTTIDVDEAARGCQLPALTLQPLVEIALLHGLAQKFEGGTITIRASIDAAQRLICEVEDNGMGLSETPARSGVGLENVKQRLQLLHGEESSLTVRSATSGGVTVRLEIPACRP